MKVVNENIFLSYSRRDSDFVLKLVEDLASNDVHVWMDQLSIHPSERWDNSIEEALDKCTVIIVLLSASSVVSENVRDEINHAYNNGKRILPILIERCKIPFRLERVQYIDFTGSYSQGLSFLLREIKGINTVINAPNTRRPFSLNKRIILLILALLGISTEILISLVPQIKKIEVKNILEVITVFTIIWGLVAEARKEQIQKKTGVPRPAMYVLNISFESSAYGGIIGGVLSGVVLAFATHLQQPMMPLYICLTTIPYCATIGVLFGGLIYLGRKLLSQYALFNAFWADFFGCLIACIIAGILSGMLGMWLFNNQYNFVGYGLILGAGFISVLFLILGSLIYDYEGKLKYIFFSLMVAFVLSSVISVLGFFLFDYAELEEKANNTTNIKEIVEVGAQLGGITGFVFGLVIGFTVIFYRYWRYAEKQQNQHYLTSNKAVA